MDHAHAPAEHGHDGGHGHHGGMSYFQVFLILLVVTIAEVAVTFVPMPKSLLIITLIVMALYKAVMVAYHFMHLKFEKKTMWLVAAAPLFLGVLITIGSYPDSEKNTPPFKKGELRPYAPKPEAAPGATGRQH
ncbi:MAG: hypothetical protein FJ293_14995 [Planctomycetes bacterium]|nr:hypothetical protein [Planctomycetota bacterium]